jgi:hypothetical protein
LFFGEDFSIFLTFKTLVLILISDNPCLNIYIEMITVGARIFGFEVAGNEAADTI